MFKLIFLVLTFTAPLFAQTPMVDFSEDQKISVQNAILAKVNGNTISMMDVKKKLDLLFHQYYSHLSHSNQARFQFYETSWRRVLMEMIDNELILSDAIDKEVKITDGEIREEMEERFGPNVLLTLEKIGLTYEDTWKLVKNEMLVRRMNWWFVQSKAVQSITPQDIRQSYRQYLQVNPPYEEWKYRVISIRSDKAEDQIADEVYRILTSSGRSPEAAQEQLKKLETPGISVQVSTEYTAADKDLSETHKAALAALEQGSYSKPSFQMSRSDRKTVYRIFYLVEKNYHPAPTFDSLSLQLRNDLIQKAVEHQTVAYLDKLRKHYGFDTAHIKKTVPDDMRPFAIE
jgi:hypothetical protein